MLLVLVDMEREVRRTDVVDRGFRRHTFSNTCEDVHCILRGEQLAPQVGVVADEESWVDFAVE